jgi:hypothetical protein
MGYCAEGRHDVRKMLLFVTLLAAASPGLAIPTMMTPLDTPLPGTTVAAEPTLSGHVMTDALVAISDFPKTEYDANWRKDGLGTVAPTSVVGQLTADFKSWIYGFRFKQPIKPGESSRFFFLTSVPGTARLTIGGGATPDFAVRAPAA